MTFIIIFWSCVFGSMIYGYIKMDDSDRQDVKDEFTRPRFIFTVGFLTGGFFLAMFGNALSVDIITWIGVALIIVGGIATVIDTWKEGMKGRSVFLLILTIVSIIIFLI